MKIIYTAPHESHYSLTTPSLGSFPATPNAAGALFTDSEDAALFAAQLGVVAKRELESPISYKDYFATPGELALRLQAQLLTANIPAADEDVDPAERTIAFQSSDFGVIARRAAQVGESAFTDLAAPAQIDTEFLAFRALGKQVRRPPEVLQDIDLKDKKHTATQKEDLEKLKRHLSKYFALKDSKYIQDFGFGLGQDDIDKK